MAEGDYDTARDRLRGRHTAAPVASAEALALVHAVLAGVRGRTTVEAVGGDTGAAEKTVDGAEDLLAALTLLRHLREELAGWEPELITAARELSVSWASLAPALGVASRQAAERRYLRLQPSATGEQTGEDRIRAERTRRAGDRAVVAWARANSGVLRRLAGQISALEGLPAPAQRRVDIVHRALSDDDASTLLGPLAGTHADLAATHHGLAEQVRSVTEQTEQLRRDAEAQRAAPP